MPEQDNPLERIAALADLLVRLLRIWAANDPDVPATIKTELLKKTREGSNYVREY